MGTCLAKGSVLSRRLLEITTDGYKSYPTEEQGDLLDVPAFIRHRLLHFIPKWFQKDPALQRRIAWIASLRIEHSKRNLGTHTACQSIY